MRKNSLPAILLSLGLIVGQGGVTPLFEEQFRILAKQDDPPGNSGSNQGNGNPPATPPGQENPPAAPPNQGNPPETPPGQEKKEDPKEKLRQEKIKKLTELKEKHKDEIARLKLEREEKRTRFGSVTSAESGKIKINDQGENAEIKITEVTRIVRVVNGQEIAINAANITATDTVLAKGEKDAQGNLTAERIIVKPQPVNLNGFVAEVKDENTLLIKKLRTNLTFEIKVNPQTKISIFTRESGMQITNFGEIGIASKINVNAETSPANASSLNAKQIVIYR